MTDYYCDPTQDYQNKSGADNSGNQLLGVGGLQAAIRGTGLATALAAGDTLYVKTGTGNLGRLTKIVGGKDISGWSLGDEVRDNTAGAHWTGVVCQLNVGANTTILVELDSVYTRTDVESNKGDGIENTTAADTTTIASTTCEGLLPDTNSGDTTDGHIKLIGVNSSWATGNGTDYSVTLDGQSVATNCIAPAGLVYRWWLENLILENAVGSCFAGGGNINDFWVFRYAAFRLAGVRGCSGEGVLRNATFYHCIFNNNTTAGFRSGGTGPRFVFCLFRDNGTYGSVLPASNAVFIMCGWSGNVLDNALDSGSDTYIGCWSDGCSAGSGFHFNGAGRSIVLLSRATNNNQYGVEMVPVVDDAQIENLNVFYNNGVTERLNIAVGPDSRTAASAAEAGYTDQAGGDFTLTDAAIMAGRDAAEIELDWTGAPANAGYFTAGLPREYVTGARGLFTGAFG